MASAKGEPAAEASSAVGQFLFQHHGERKGKQEDRARLFFARVVVSSGPRGEEAAFRAAQCHQALGKTEAAQVLTKRTCAGFPPVSFVDQGNRICRSLER